jgi:hypothetical protein
MANPTIVLPPAETAAVFDRGEVIAAPVTPTNLSGASGDTSVTLVWNFQFGLLGWEIYKSEADDVSLDSTMIEVSANSSSYRDTDVVNGTTYYYKIRAKTRAGFSDLSATASCTPMFWASTKSILLNGTDEYFSLASNELDVEFGSTSVTIDAWIYKTAGSGVRAVLTNFDTASDRGWYFAAAGSVNIVIKDSAGTTHSLTSNNTVTASVWQHIVMVYDHTTRSITSYVNLNPRTVSNLSPALTTMDYSAAVPRIGSISGGAATTFWSGNIAQITYWSGALSLAQVTELYNSGDPVNPTTVSFATSLRHAWLMGDTPGDSHTSVADAIGTSEATGVNTDPEDLTSTVP